MKARWAAAGRIFGALLACLPALSPAPLMALDIADFLDLTPGKVWQLTGTGQYGANYFDVNGSLAISAAQEGPAGAVLLYLDLSGGSARLTQSLVLSLDETGLFMHSRRGVLYYFGFVVDDDNEVYLSPVMILPRMVNLTTSYPFVAELPGGSVNDSILIDVTEYVSNSSGWAAQALRVVFFTSDDVPVRMWLARGVGFVNLSVETQMSGQTLNVYVKQKPVSLDWNPDLVRGMWENTRRLGGGWRLCDWFGYIYAPTINSAWVYQNGLGWAYCVGQSSSMWFYADGLGWMWTQGGMYPVVYSYSRSTFLYYVDQTGSRWFWDYASGQWVELRPGG